MKKLISVLFALIVSISVNAQEKKDNIFKQIFKYSTPYVSYSQGSSLQGPQTFYVTQNSELIETTVRNPENFAFNFGIRKISRFGYQDRLNWYTGNEDRSASENANIGSVDGLEYLINISNGRQQGREFTNNNYFVRYVGKYYIAKFEHLKNEIVDIEYNSLDVRFKLPIGKRLNFSVGAVARTNPIAYGHNPIQKYFDDGNAWWELAYQFHYDQLYEMIDPFTGESLGYDYLWFDQDDNLISSSDEDYRRLHFGKIVNQFNANELAQIGDFTYLSAIASLDYYFYRRNVWVHGFVNVLPYHKLLDGDSRYSYDNYIENDKWIDIKGGIVFGFKINKWFGLFTEYNYQSYWGKEFESIKTGVNIKL